MTEHGPTDAGRFASAEMFEALSSALTEGIVIVDRDGRILHLNDPARLLVGTLAADDTPDSLSVRSVAGDPLSVEQHPSRRAMAGGEVVREEVILTLRDGRERLVVVTATPLALDPTRPDAPGAVVVYRDVTDERRHAEVLMAMYEAMTEGLIVVDDGGLIVEQNGAARHLLAQTATAGSPNIFDYPLCRLDGALVPREEHACVRARAERRSITEDVVLRLADGQERILAVTAAPLTGGFAFAAQPSVLAVFRDVTDERRRAGQLADFASVVAHDLRSPLAATVGWLDMADELSDDHLQMVRALGRARGGVDRMTALIGDLLNQALADGGEINPDVVDLRGPDGLVAEVAGMVDPDEVADIQTDDDVPPVVGDVDMLTQLFSNLIGNSLKYVAPGTVPRVRLSGRVEGRRVELELSDNGIGIPEDHRALVFERFHRAHVADDRYTGTGLGLAICRTIVERHGGRIVAADGLGGEGTTFRFDLPAERDG